MSDTSDTSTLDEKRTPSSTSEYVNNVSEFSFTVLHLFIVVLIYFSTSGLLLYACKASQSNILPTDIDCSPYTNSIATNTEIITNMFKTATDKGEMSLKLKFPTSEFNSDYKILGSFSNYKNKPSSNFLAMYFISIIESILVFNYSSFDSILSMLNGLNEFLIVLIGPIILIGLVFALFFCDVGYFVYLWFSQMSWFFKKNTNTGKTGQPTWEDVGMTDPMGFSGAFMLLFVFSILFFFIIHFMFIFSFILPIISILTLITYSSTINDKPANLLTIIKLLLLNYKTLIMGVFSFFVVKATFTKLGPAPGVVSLIMLLLVVFGIIKSDMFVSTILTNLSPIVKDKQSIKKCTHPETKSINKGGFLSMFF